jgi:hypothetical protein
MSNVPDSPRDFFTSYLPSRVEAVKSSLAGKTSAGAMTFRLHGGGGIFSLRLTAGALEVTEAEAPDVIVQITVSEADFGPLFVEGARRQETETPNPARQVLAFKALTADPERIKLVKNVPGSLAFVIRDGDAVRKTVLTPGAQAVKYDDPECRLETTMADFLEMESGKQQPIQLVMAGRVKIVGNAQIPMALSAVFL